MNQPYQMGPGYPNQGYPMMQPGLNMGNAPAVYASAAPSAQVFSSGVPGAPPTIAVPTDDLSMQQFGSPQNNIRPNRGTTLKRRSNQPFGSAQESAPSVDSNTRINVIKGS